MNHVPSPLMELEVLEMQREIRRRRTEAILHPHRRPWGTMKQTIGRGMIRAGSVIAGVPVNGA